jgi:hypothetical protein
MLYQRGHKWWITSRHFDFNRGKALIGHITKSFIQQLESFVNIVCVGIVNPAPVIYLQIILHFYFTVVPLITKIYKFSLRLSRYSFRVTTTAEWLGAFHKWGILVKKTSSIRAPLVGFLTIWSKLCWMQTSYTRSWLTSPAIIILALGCIITESSHSIQIKNQANQIRCKLAQVDHTLQRRSMNHSWCEFRTRYIRICYQGRH